MEKDNRRDARPGQMAGGHVSQDPSRPAPGKVTRSSRLSSERGPAVQRKEAAAGTAMPRQSRSLSAHTADLWMDAAHRGAQALVQAKMDPGTAGDEPGARASGSGQAMPAQVQAKMERGLDADFSDVRIHQGPQAASLGARAYTQGTDIHFQPGLYQPDSQQGQELLGHELAHVVQQSQGRVQARVQAKGVGINDDDALEREADMRGAAAARGESPAPAMRQPVVQRMDSQRVVQRMDNGEAESASAEPASAEPASAAPAAALPRYLYHATRRQNAESIAREGLKPRSVGGSEGSYLCMSGTESGAKTLGSQASDIIFRVSRDYLDAGSWSKQGAGKQEWRSTETIPADHLECRRNLGSAQQRAWKAASALLKTS